MVTNGSISRHPGRTPSPGGGVDTSATHSTPFHAGDEPRDPAGFTEKGCNGAKTEPRTLAQVLLALTPVDGHHIQDHAVVDHVVDGRHGGHPRQVVVYAIGDRSQVTCRHLWEAIPLVCRTGHCFTDFWECIRP
jgi:hypothetical protein